MKKLNQDDINDLKVLIVGDLVLEGLVKDCTDTNDNTEFDFQDTIEETLKKRFTELGIYED